MGMLEESMQDSPRASIITKVDSRPVSSHSTMLPKLQTSSSSDDQPVSLENGDECSVKQEKMSPSSSSEGSKPPTPLPTSITISLDRARRVGELPVLSSLNESSPRISTIETLGSVLKKASAASHSAMIPLIQDCSEEQQPQLRTLPLPAHCKLPTTTISTAKQLAMPSGIPYDNFSSSNILSALQHRLLFQSPGIYSQTSFPNFPISPFAPSIRNVMTPATGFLIPASFKSSTSTSVSSPTDCQSGGDEQPVSEQQRRPVKRGRPQQAMESDTDDDPVVQKKRHRRLYARNYRAQLREKLDVVDDLRKQIETMEKEHEAEIQAIRNEHRDMMDKTKEIYSSELQKRDELFAMLLRRTM